MGDAGSRPLTCCWTLVKLQLPASPCLPCKREEPPETCGLCHMTAESLSRHADPWMARRSGPRTGMSELLNLPGSYLQRLCSWPFMGCEHSSTGRGGQGPEKWNEQWGLHLGEAAREWPRGTGETSPRPKPLPATRSGALAFCHPRSDSNPNRAPSHSPSTSPAAATPYHWRLDTSAFHVPRTGGHGKGGRWQDLTQSDRRFLAQEGL